jgi:glutamine synthetase
MSYYGTNSFFAKCWVDAASSHNILVNVMCMPFLKDAASTQHFEKKLVHTKKIDKKFKDMGASKFSKTYSEIVPGRNT